MALFGLFNKKKNEQEKTAVTKESLEEREARLKEEKVKSEIDSAVQMIETGKLDEGITILEKHARDGRMIAIYHLAEAMTKKGKYKVALQYANLVVDSPAGNEYKQGASALIEKINANLETEKRAEEERKKAELEKQKPKSNDDELQELMNKLDAAFEEKLAELEQIEQEAEDEKAMQVIDEAVSLMEEGKWDDALQMLLNPAEKGYVLAGYYMAVALAEKGEYEQALRWAKIVVNSEIEEEGKQEARKLIENIEERIEEQQKAEQEKIERQNEIERLKKITKEGVETFKAGKAEKALQCWKEAAELGFIPSMFYLAQACSRRGEVNEAIAWLEKLIKCNLDEAGTKKCNEIFDYCVQQAEIYNKGLGLCREGKYQEAIENLKISANQGFMKSQLMLADLYSDDQRIPADENESYKWYKMAAQQGDVESQRKVGIRTFNGTGTDEDTEKGIKWLTLAAEQGDVASQCILADVYYDGNGIERDYNNAYKWAKVAAEQGTAKAQYMLGRMYLAGHGVKEDSDIAIQWFVSAAEKNFAEAQLKLGDIYKWGLGKISKDIGKAIEWYLMAAESGNAEGQSNLINLYSESGDYYNKKEAFKWCKVLAEAGNVDGQRRLGKYYYEGFGTELNKKEAFRWRKLAAEQGDRYAKSYLAQMYEQGDGISKNIKEAQRLYTEAAELGEKYARYKVAQMYYTGEGRVKDRKKALELYEDAAINHRSGEAYYELGRFYEYGELVKKDKNKSAKFYREAFMNYGFDNGLKIWKSALNALERLAMQKCGDAAYYLGELYYCAYMVEKNKKEAFKWCEMAMENGCENYTAAWMLSDMYENGEGTEKDDAKSLYWARESLRLQHEAYFKEHPEYDFRNQE